MALREYTDGDGMLWQIWNVRPAGRYSSPLARAERRRRSTPHYFPDRRAGRSALTPGLEGGWLCFECSDEKRRLVPAPGDWATCDEQSLERYLKASKPIRRRIVDEGEGPGAQARLA